MPSLYTEIDIRASRSRVWQALIRKEQWLYWNTFLYDLNSKLPFQQGRSVALSLRRVAGEPETQFQPIVTLVQPTVCLRWHSVVPGLRNEHVFELQDIGAGYTRYVHQDRFSGWLAGFFFPFIRQDEQRGIDRMARELKRYIEAM